MLQNIIARYINSIGFCQNSKSICLMSLPLIQYMYRSNIILYCQWDLSGIYSFSVYLGYGACIIAWNKLYIYIYIHPAAKRTGLSRLWKIKAWASKCHKFGLSNIISSKVRSWNNFFICVKYCTPKGTKWGIQISLS